MHEQIIKNLISLGKTDVEYIKKSLTEFYFKNTENFLTSIENNDIEQAKIFLKDGLVWNKGDTWKKLYNKYKHENTPEDVSNLIYSLKADEIFASSSSSLRDKDYDSLKKLFSKTTNTIYKFSIFCDFMLNKEMYSVSISNINTYAMRNTYFYSTKKISDNLSKNNYEQTYFLKNMCNALISNGLKANNDITEKIISDNPEKTINFIIRAKNQDNDFVKDLIKKIKIDEITKKDLMIKTLKSETVDKIELFRQLGFNFPLSIQENNDCMTHAVTHGEIDKIKYFRQFNIELPIEKISYSQLFSSLKNKEAMLYIINEVPDIKVGSHVILKTLLHYNFSNMILSALERYPKNNQSTQELTALIEKRERKTGVEHIERFINLCTLNDKLPLKITDKIKHKI